MTLVVRDVVRHPRVCERNRLCLRPEEVMLHTEGAEAEALARQAGPLLAGSDCVHKVAVHEMLELLQSEQAAVTAKLKVCRALMRDELCEQVAFSENLSASVEGNG